MFDVLTQSHMYRTSEPLSNVRVAVVQEKSCLAPSSAHGYAFIRTLATRAQYASGLCVRVRLYVCLCVCVWIYVCRQKTRLFASYRSKISTKTLSAASSLNL